MIVPGEKVQTQPRAGIATVLLSAIVVLAAANFAYASFLKSVTLNGGYRLAEKKWELLQDAPDDIDYLFVGDSSCNQGLDAAYFHELTGKRALNLCTIGNMAAIDDALMVSEFIGRYGAPPHIVVLHVDDVWPRDDESINSALHILPSSLQTNVFAQGGITPTLRNRVHYLINRHLPLYAENASLQTITRAPFSFRIPTSAHDTIDDFGFASVEGADEAGVRTDRTRRLRGVDEALSAPLSEANRRSVARLQQLSREHDAQLHFVMAPLEREFAQSEQLREFVEAVSAELLEAAPDADFRLFRPDLANFDAAEMESVDHVVGEAAQRFTEIVATGLTQ